MWLQHHKYKVKIRPLSRIPLSNKKNKTRRQTRRKMIESKRNLVSSWVNANSIIKQMIHAGREQHTKLRNVGRMTKTWNQLTKPDSLRRRVKILRSASLVFQLRLTSMEEHPLVKAAEELLSWEPESTTLSPHSEYSSMLDDCNFRLLDLFKFVPFS